MQGSSRWQLVWCAEGESSWRRQAGGTAIHLRMQCEKCSATCVLVSLAACWRAGCLGEQVVQLRPCAAPAAALCHQLAMWYAKALCRKLGGCALFSVLTNSGYCAAAFRSFLSMCLVGFALRLQSTPADKHMALKSMQWWCWQSASVVVLVLFKAFRLPRPPILQLGLAISRRVSVSQSGGTWFLGPAY
jgi:hypothetical protein